jgi:probable rRNA maturation factor
MRKTVAGATEQSLSRFLNRARRAAGLRGGVNVLVTSSRELRSLNRRFRGLDKATDVLSFSAPPIAALSEGEVAGDDVEGDIAISAEIACRNAQSLGHPPLDELKILMLHGLLHLAGHDHEADDGKMARAERRLRRQLGLPDGLIERSTNGSPRSAAGRSAVNSRRRS